MRDKPSLNRNIRFVLDVYLTEYNYNAKQEFYNSSLAT